MGELCTLGGQGRKVNRQRKIDGGTWTKGKEQKHQKYTIGRNRTGALRRKYAVTYSQSYKKRGKVYGFAVTRGGRRQERNGSIKKLQELTNVERRENRRRKKRASEAQKKHLNGS